jgi:APA family basic amino acid/polyamine antiporter
MSHSADDVRARAPLGLWDVVSIMLGIVVGAGIYETPPIVLQNVAGPWEALAAWTLGGVMSLVGAFCLAELAAAYPRSGGDYVYLTRAFWPWLGFLFAWFQLSVVRAANIAMMGFVFADYAASIWRVPFEWKWAWAGAAVLVLTVLNLLGVVFGKRTQNVLTLAKVIGLGGVLVFGFASEPRPLRSGELPLANGHGSGSPPSLATAMVLVLLTYGGWNDAAFVAAEVRGGPRSIARALLLGTAAITLLYLLVNAAFLWGLGFDRARQSSAIAADLLAHRLGPWGKWGARAIALLVMISALGAINGMLFSGARIYASLGVDHPVFAWLGRIHQRTGTPWGALMVQSAVSLGLIGVVGTPDGRDWVNGMLTRAGLENVEWKGHGGFEVLSVVTTPVFWLFFLFTGLAVFVLRRRDPHLPRPFRVPLYPVLPLTFCGICAYMIYAGVKYATAMHMLGGLLVAALALGVVGLLLYRVSQWMTRRSRARSAAE